MEAPNHACSAAEAQESPAAAAVVAVVAAAWQSAEGLGWLDTCYGSYWQRLRRTPLGGSWKNIHP